MNKKQRKQIITLIVLCILWAVSAHYNKITLSPPSVLKTTAAKVVQTESPLKARFRKLHGEVDALYRYRVKPAPFDAQVNLFRIPGAKVALDTTIPKEFAPPPAAKAEDILKKALANIRIGGVVTMNGVMQLTVDGQLHKVGDVFTSKIPAKVEANAKQAQQPATKTVLLKLKSLSDYSATVAIDDPDIGAAELKIHLK